MDRLLRHYPEKYFGGFTDVDGTMRFYNRVRGLMDENSVVVEVGCGRGARAGEPIVYKRQILTLKGNCRWVIGIDLDEAARDNPLLDEFRLMTDAAHWPLDDESVDLCVADNVMEHVEDPAVFFSECRRVLRPGGCVAIRTPNRWGYVALLATMVPGWLHGRVLRRAQETRQEEDIFPKVYRCNTRRQLRRRLRQAGFEPCVYGFTAEPTYLEFSRLACWLGALHQRWTPRWFHVNLLALGRKLN